MATPQIAVLATLDTKLVETRFVVDQIRSHGGEPVVLNLGTSDVDDPIVGFRQDVIRAASGRALADTPSKVDLMESAAEGARAILRDGIATGSFDAVIAIGGGQGSWMSSAAMRDLPLGFPRLLVSTAGRDVGQYTQFSDITSVFSVTDVAGLNPLLRRVLATAAAGICGMARSKSWAEPMPQGLTAMTVYGITTPGARIVMPLLEAKGIEVVAFHSNGVGGPTMEGQIAAGTFGAVLDWSITEVADDVVGGVCAVGPDRLRGAPRAGLPQVIVPGGVDVVNFGAPSTIPEHLRGRPMYAHTPEASLVRTSVEDNIAIAELVADRIGATVAPIHVIVPLGGFSTLSVDGGPIADRAADAAFLETLRASVAHNPAITVSSHPGAINSSEFATHTAERFIDLVSTYSSENPPAVDHTGAATSHP